MTVNSKEALKSGQWCNRCDGMTGHLTSGHVGPPPLPVEQAWVIGCSRCANEATAYCDSAAAADAELRNAGWTYEYPRVFCPACNGEVRR